MGTDDLLTEILAALKRLERAQEPLPSASRPDPRPTESFSKTELAIAKAIEMHAEKCATAMKERLQEKTAPLLEKIKALENTLGNQKTELGTKINGVKQDVAKATTEFVVSATEKAETALRILKGREGEPGLEEMVRDLGQWIEDEETARERARQEVSEKSRFSLTTLLTILGILAAIGLGVLNLVLGK